VFHLRGGQQKKVPMMTQTRGFSYRQGTGYQAVRLGYKDRNLGMYVFLRMLIRVPRNCWRSCMVATGNGSPCQVSARDMAR